MTTFVDPALETDLIEQGYATFPVLEPGEVADLRDAYKALVPQGDHGLTVDYMRPDRGPLREIARLLEPVWARHFPEIFTDHVPVFTTFVTKHPGENSNMGLHEDGTFVDERRFRSGTLWIPLVDVSTEAQNGTLELLPGSHRLSESWSGPRTPLLHPPFERYLRQRLLPVTLTAGTGIYYDTRTLHASSANRSNEIREALVCAVAPRAASVIRVVATSRRHRTVHEVDRDFFLDVHPHEADDRIAERFPPIEEFDDDSRLDADRVVALMGPGDALDLPGEPRRYPYAHVDPPIDAATLAVTGTQPPPSIELSVASGGAALAAAGTDDLLGLPDPFRRWLRDLDFTGATSHDASHSLLLVIDARTTCTVVLPSTEPDPVGGDGWELHPLDVATSAATVTVDAAAPLTLDERRWVRLTDGASLTVDHVGPGPLVALLQRTADRSDPVEEPQPAPPDVTPGLVPRLRRRLRAVARPRPGWNR